MTGHKDIVCIYTGTIIVRTLSQLVYATGETLYTRLTNHHKDNDMNKWEAIAIAIVFVAMFGSITMSAYSKEKTKQYRIQYNCLK